MAGFPAIIFDADARRSWLAARTTRSVRAAGAGEISMTSRGQALPNFKRPALFIRAGAWLRSANQPLTPPAASATGRGVVAIGLPSRGDASGAWRDAMRETGGDFSKRAALPPIVCAWTDDSSVLADVSDAIRAGHRVVHLPSLDVDDDRDSQMRVVQVVTSLQHGGAEQVTWDLHQLLPQHGIDTCLVTLGRPLRKSLPDPPGRVDLSKLDYEQRIEAVARVAVRFGADVLHLHLLGGGDVERLAETGVPIVITAHNMRPGWPDALENIPSGAAALVVACARAVERDLAAAGVAAPLRTAWNGIDVGAFASAARNPDPAHLTIACVANPRPQKRLHLLPTVLRAVEDQLRARGDTRSARLIVAGELAADGGPPAAAQCVQEMLDAAGALRLSHRIEWTNGRRTVPEVLAQSDVLISASAHEGLSLAHLEALAAGLPVVATDVGGTAELAHANPAVGLVAPDASAQTFADAILTSTSTDGVEAVRRNFSRERMASRYAWLYRAAVHGPARGSGGGGDTLWFVANNLCTGGAQSSLRRLVKTFHAEGVAVRVAVLQEYAEHPTPGREDLLSAGVPVTVLPPAGTLDPADAVEMLLAEMRETPPRAVTFWNAIQSYKLMIADALLSVPVFDVSPGEMFFDSLEAYFARPRGGMPYRSPRDYGERLAGVVVKYMSEAVDARERLGAPVSVIPNGVALRPARSGKPAGGPLVIGTAARLHPHKRIEDLLDAFRLALPRLPGGTVLRVAGEADHACEQYVATLREQSRDLPVEWLGNVSDVAAFHDRLDLFAMISEPAGCPNASLEAMAAGLPVVGTDVGGAAEQVLDRVTGRVVPPRDAKAFADALVGLGNCAECRARQGAAARERIATHFSLERMAAGYRTLLLS